MADIAHEVVGSHLRRKTTHEIATSCDALLIGVLGAWATKVSRALVHIEDISRNLLFELPAPQIRAVDVLQIYSLSIWLLVILVVPLVRELGHIIKIMSDGQRHVLVLAQVAGLLN